MCRQPKSNSMDACDSYQRWTWCMGSTRCKTGRSCCIPNKPRLDDGPLAYFCGSIEWGSYRSISCKLSFSIKQHFERQVSQFESAWNWCLHCLEDEPQVSSVMPVKDPAFSYVHFLCTVQLLNLIICFLNSDSLRKLESIHCYKVWTGFQATALIFVICTCAKAEPELDMIAQSDAACIRFACSKHMVVFLMQWTEERIFKALLSA